MAAVVRAGLYRALTWPKDCQRPRSARRSSRSIASTAAERGARHCPRPACDDHRGRARWPSSPSWPLGSGYASAKWSTESRLDLARASTARVEGNRAADSDAETLEFDASAFDAWFTAYVAGNEEAMAIAERRFRPEFEVAFAAWIATEPASNPDAPPGPTYMPEYERPDVDEAKRLDAEADASHARARRPARWPTAMCASRSSSPRCSSSSASAGTSGPTYAVASAAWPGRSTSLRPGSAAIAIGGPVGRGHRQREATGLRVDGRRSASSCRSPPKPSVPELAEDDDHGRDRRLHQHGPPMWLASCIIRWPSTSRDTWEL